MNLRKLLVAVAAAVTLIATLAVPRAAFAWHDGPGSQGNRSADLGLSATGPEKASEGYSFTVDYLITNNGPDSAGSAKLTIQFDSSKAAFGWGDRCTASGSTVTCSLGDAHGVFSLGSQESKQVSFRALTSGETFVSDATVSAKTKDPNTSNNTASVSVPLVFEYGCQGEVSPAVSVYGPGVYWSGSSCQTWLGLSTSRNVLLELKPQPNFEGVLTAQLRSPGAPIIEVSGTFVAGQLVSGTASRTATLPAGEWTLAVWVKVVAESVSTPPYYGYFCTRPPLPWWCKDVYVPGIQKYVYHPVSYGGFGGLVTAVQ